MEAGAYYKGMRVERPGFSVKTIETNGEQEIRSAAAPSIFFLSMISIILQKEELGEMLTFANAAGSNRPLQRKGAIKAMPEREDVNQLIEQGMNPELCRALRL